MKKIILTVITVFLSFPIFSQVGKAEHLVFIGLDGWGSYCMGKADMPVTRQLMQSGAYTLKKRSVLPSSSAINWASMFMGACQEIHGYTEWNSQTPEIPSRAIYKNGIFPTIFQILRDQYPSSEIGCIYEWSGIKYVVDTLSLSYSEQVPSSDNTNATTCEMAIKYIMDKKPNFFAIIFDEPDHIGHKEGHDTKAYYLKVHELDGYIGRIIQATKNAGIYDNTTFVLTGDHGGINKGHGGKTLQELESPFIISGKHIKKIGEFQESMMQFDIAPTLAYIFNLKAPQVWNGRAMKQVFKK
ncbi:MAG: alkaline phosphatase [Bacteroides sp.]|jgi:predicted AlkP superfamily pyrophosphatase or phosphodiesterase|nr:alkaline phosphatase [Bacteroides sp.]